MLVLNCDFLIKVCTFLCILMFSTKKSTKYMYNYDNHNFNNKDSNFNPIFIDALWDLCFPIDS